MKLNSSQIEIQFKESFPNNSGKLAFELWNDIVHLRYYWIIFNGLFGDTQQKVDILSKISKTFFLLVHNSFINAIKLEICKLVDPAKTGRFENASLYQLFEKVKNNLDEDIRNEIENKLSELYSKSKPVRGFRDKLIAHNDLSTRLNTRETPLSPVFFEELKSIIFLIEGLMNVFEYSFSLNKTSFDKLMHLNEVDYLMEIFENHLNNQTN